MAYARNGDCKIFYETFGDPANPALILVNGLGSQCINYHENWCALFVAEGLHVIRFDNRDVGLSSKFDDAAAGPKGEAYVLSDMARDPIAVLDALGIAVGSGGHRQAVVRRRIRRRTARVGYAGIRRRRALAPRCRARFRSVLPSLRRGTPAAGCDGL